MSLGALKTVLIFAHECAPHNRPESTIGAQRPAGFAKHLPEFGWRPIVVACDAAARRTFARAEAARLRQRLADEIDGAQSNGALRLFTPSLASSSVLDAAWVRLTGNGSGNGARRWLARGLSFLLWSNGDYSRSWQPCARLAAREIQRRLRVDVALGEHGPDAGLHLARWFSRRYGVPWIADFRDPVVMPFRRMARRLYERRAQRWLATAAATVNVTPGWTRLDRTLFGRPAFTVRNGFEPDEYVAARRRREPGPLRVTYTGQVFHPLQRMDVFLAGLRRFQDVGRARRHAVEFVYAGPHAELMRALAIRTGVTSGLYLSERVARAEALALQQRADIALVVGLTADPTLDWSLSGFLPGKVYEYLGAGLPVLCAPSDHADLHALLEQAGGVTFADTPEDVAGALAQFVERAFASPDGGLPPVRRDVRPYSRRESARRLAALLDAVAAGRDLAGLALPGDAC